MALSTRLDKKPTASAADPAEDALDQQLVVRAFSPKQETYLKVFKAEISASINANMNAKFDEMMQKIM